MTHVKRYMISVFGKKGLSKLKKGLRKEGVKFSVHKVRRTKQHYRVYPKKRR